MLHNIVYGDGIVRFVHFAYSYMWLYSTHCSITLLYFVVQFCDIIYLCIYLFINYYLLQGFFTRTYKLLNPSLVFGECYIAQNKY
jgi:hypothetical protein